MTTNKLGQFIKLGQKLVNRELKRHFPGNDQLTRAMKYSLFAGGKRLRPILCLATAEALGINVRKVLPLAAAVEMVHTFTLIHDDLPAMDNSNLRRGKPTCHVVYGEALALLAGDALNTMAFKVIAHEPKATKELAARLIDVVEGQVEDLALVGGSITFSKLKRIHRLKTAALIKACLIGSASIARASQGQVKALASYAEHLGLAFQIADDILDATSTAKSLGKPVGADDQKGFPYLFGLKRSRLIATQEKEKAKAALKPFGKKAGILIAIADYVVDRSN